MKNNIEDDFTGIKELLANQLISFVILDIYLDKAEESDIKNRKSIFCLHSEMIYIKMRFFYKKHKIISDTLFFFKTNKSIYLFETQSKKFTMIMSYEKFEQMQQIQNYIKALEEKVHLLSLTNSFTDLSQYDLSNCNEIKSFNIFNISKTIVELNLDTISYNFLSIISYKKIKFFSQNQIFFMEVKENLSLLSDNSYKLYYEINKKNNCYFIKLSKYLLYSAK